MMLEPKSNRVVVSDIPMVEFSSELIEDEYGYVEPVGDSHKISHNIMMQLPSRNFDGLVSDYEQTLKRDHCRDASLKRKESRYLTMKLKRVAIKSGSINDDVDKVYELLTADPDIEEDEIKHNLRDMHQSLTLKRMVKAKLDNEQAQKKQHIPVDCFTKYKYQMAMGWQKFKYDLKGLSYSLALWHDHLKKVQGHFGSGVASYFIFLRWLLYLNIFNSVLLSGFIVCPQLVFQSNSTEVNYKAKNSSFTGYDLITGSDWIRDTVFYYGHYTNETVHNSENLFYDMPLAYLFTVGVLALINLIVVAHSVTKSYQESYIASSGDIKNVFCNKVFCAWEFSIETSGAALLRKRCIYNELKELLYLQKRAKEEKSFFILVWEVLVGFIVNSFIISIIIATGYLVYFILDSEAVKVDIEVLDKMTLALTVTSITITFYYLISFATKLEYFFAKQTRLYLTIGRAVMLRIIILGVLIHFWMVKPTPEFKGVCHETDLGEEIYRLIIVSFFMHIILCVFLGEYMRKFISKYICSFIQVPEFDIAYNTIDVIYYQTLIWIGIFYIPLAPVLLTIILFLLFYLKLCSIKINHQPSEKPWSAAQAQTVFLVLIFMNLILSIIAIGYSIFSIKPSATCGPFRNKDYAYEVVADLLEDSKTKDLLTVLILSYAGSPAVLFTVLLSLCVAVYFARARAKAQGEIVTLVREQLIMEGKDKVFLLRLFESAYEAKMRSQIVPATASAASCSVLNDSGDRYSGADSQFDVMHQMYKDNHEDSGKNFSATSFGVFQAKYDPGHLLADVPANNLSSGCEARRSSLSDNKLSPCTQTAKVSFQQVNENNKKFENSPYMRGRKQQSCESPQPGYHAKRRQSELPRPVHQQGFQYLIHDETPPRSSGQARPSLSPRNMS